MPKKFDDMVKAIQDTGKSEQDAYAIATTQWKKSHGGKAPQRESVVDEITRYLEEEGQPELFSVDTMLNKRIEVPEELKERLHAMGAQAAEDVTELIMRRVKSILINELRKMNYEPTGSGPGQFLGDSDDLEEEVRESDAFMMLTMELSREYLEGMEEAWSHPIVNW